MVFLLCLAIAAILSTFIYLFTKPLRKGHATISDVEKSLASVDNGMDKEGRFSHAPFLYSQKAMSSPWKADQEAADAQLLNELAAVTPPGPGPTQNVTNSKSLEKLPERALYINPKQYNRILKRRIFRQEFAESLRKAQMAKAQKRTSGRSKVPEGMMMALS